MSWGISSKLFFNPIETLTLEMGGNDTAYVLGGALYMCGDNTYGQLGATPGTVPANTFKQSTIPNKYIDYVNCGDTGNIAVITRDNLLYTRGLNNYGQLGNTQNIGTTNPNTDLTQITITGKTPILAVYGLYNLVVVTMDGSLYTCGNNQYGQLGNFTNVGTTLPNPGLSQISISGKTVASAHYGGYMLAVITTDGMLYTCGLNDFGQLGYSTNVGTTTPNPLLAAVSVPGGKVVSDVFIGTSFMIVKTSDGYVYACGSNQFGQLGRTENAGTTTPNPTLTVMNFDFVANPARKIFCSGNFSAIETTNNTLFTCGSNLNGQLGRSVNAGTTVANPTLGQVVIPSQTIVTLSCGTSFMGTLTQVGQLWTCGSNQFGQLGYPTTNNTLNATLQRVTIPFDGTNVVGDIVQPFDFPTNTTCTTQRVPNTGQYYDPCYFYF